MTVDDGFTGAKLGRDSGGVGFDAGAYSFFGDLGSVEDGLEGALEEGLEAPPEEELPADPDLLLDADEDLSYASMFAAALDSGGGNGNHAALESGSTPTAGTGEARASSSTPGSSLFQDFQVSADLMNPTPSHAAKQLGSIALGGLLAGGTPGSPFGEPTPGRSPFGGFHSAVGTSAAPQQPSPLQGSAAMHGAGGTPPVALPVQGPSHMGGPLRGRGMTAEELEAQLLGGLTSQEQPQQVAFPDGMAGAMGLEGAGMRPPGMPQGAYLGHIPHHMQAPPPGYGPPPGVTPQGHMHMQRPPGDGHLQALPPGYGPSPSGHPSHMHAPPQPPPHFSPGAAFPPMGGRPPPRPIPMQQPGMFALGPAPPPGYSGPPPHLQNQRPPPHPQQHQHQQLEGQPRPPPGFMPHQHQHQHQRPGPPGTGPPHMPPGPAGPPGPSPWGPPRPPMPAPGQQQQQQQQQQQRPSAAAGQPPPNSHANLAQRLRAMNLADRQEEVRRPVLRRRYSSRYMDHEEIEHILAIQWRAVHTTAPYLEDYYFQAFLYKYFGRRNRRTFAPESVRELAPTEKMAPGEVAFVKVEGLGRLPFSNIRRPRPLMDVAPGAPGGSADGSGGGQGEGDGQAGGGSAEGVPARPLDQEPLLAARIMIEDCMCLILDVLDIDQILVAGAGGPVENESALRTRRMLLMDGLAASLRLPEGAVAAPPTPGAAASAAAASAEAGDGVFLRLMSVTKGKKLLARALRVIYPAPEAAQPSEEAEFDSAALPPQRANLRIVWAALRSLRYLFAGRPGHAEDAAASAAVASAAAEVLRRLHSPQAVADALAAVLAGDLDGAPLLDSQPDAVLMPLYAPGTTAQDAQLPWLVDVLTALLQRAAELDLLPATVPPDGARAAAAAWRLHLPRLYALVERHVAALHEAFQAGVAMGEAEAAAEVKALVPISLVRVLLPHCTKEQAQVLRGYIRDLGV